MSREQEEEEIDCFETKKGSLELGGRKVVSILRQELNVGLGPHHSRTG